jgi:hypothetical protein
MGISSRRAAAKAYYDNMLMPSFGEDSDDEADLLMAAADMVNENFLIPPRRGGSSKEREPTSIVIEKLATRACIRTISTRSCRSIMRRHFNAGIGCPENYFWSY